uniref:FHA domain-containing protein n=1 Tax=Kalanchoe fedtschenkoi TaxID=63787 RepID=A0A7N0TI25_KALFE
MGRHDRSESPATRRRESPRRRDRSPSRHRTSRRSDSPVRAISSLKSRSSERDKLSTRPRSPKSSFPSSRSPSPRTKRLRKIQAERKEDKSGDRRWERGEETDGGGGKSGRGRDKENNSLKDRGERRSAKRERSDSPTHHRGREKLDSRSHTKDRRLKDYHEDKGAGAVEPNGIDDDSVAKMKAAEEALAAKKKEQPSFELSGKLADETNRVKGVTLLFNEPPEARKPDIRWRLYVFKAGEMLNEPLYIHRQSCYLFGRERRVADIPTDHPSCSKQHAVIQYRQIEKEQPDGMLKKITRPYLMDLGSTNGTFINDNRLEPQRYYELIEQDTIKFGNSSREYVILHENSAKGE